MQVWRCKIGIKENVTIPDGADWPMRRVAQEQFRRVAGVEADFCFSGWGGILSSDELEYVNGTRLDKLPESAKLDQSTIMENEMAENNGSDVANQEIMEYKGFSVPATTNKAAKRVLRKLKKNKFLIVEGSDDFILELVHIADVAGIHHTQTDFDTLEHKLILVTPKGYKKFVVEEQ